MVWCWHNNPDLNEQCSNLNVIKVLIIDYKGKKKRGAILRNDSHTHRRQMLPLLV